MAKAPLTARIKDAYKDGVVFYTQATTISFTELIDVYGSDGQLLPLSKPSSFGPLPPEVTGPLGVSLPPYDYTFLRFSIVSGFPSGYSTLGSTDHITNDQGIAIAGDMYPPTLETSASATPGVYQGLLKVELLGSKNLQISGNYYQNFSHISITYVTLPIIVEETPTVAIGAQEPTIIRNGDLLMDVGVSQNIKVTFNSIYQTFYTRVTGLPAGMRYTGSPDGFLSGFISGVPLASGSYNVTISTTYKASEGGETLNTSKTIVYTVNEPNAPTILLGNQNLTSGQSVNLPLRASDVSAIIGWSATGLPAGLTCGTGAIAAITGTPTTAGTYNSTISLSCRKINSSETITVTKPVTFTIS